MGRKTGEVATWPTRVGARGFRVWAFRVCRVYRVEGL